MFRKAFMVPLKIPLAIFLSIVSIAGCQSQREDRPAETDVPEAPVEGDTASAGIERARQYLANGDPGAAAAALNQVDIATVVSAYERFEWIALDAEISLHMEAFSAAEERLRIARPTDTSQRSRLALLSARIYAERKDHVAASSALIDAARDDAADGGKFAPALLEDAWRYGQRVPGHRIADRLRRVDESSERAWWQLIDAFNEALATRDQQDVWERWRTRHSQHVAARFLRRTFVGIDPEPARIALFLPFSGRLANAAETVRDGFLSAYFLSRAGTRQSIRVYDTAADSIAVLYRQALRDGTDFIVGPLSKENAADLWAIDPNVPTLTLNTVAVSTKDRTHPVQFALTVEDEARAIAQRVMADGRRRVIVLRSGENWTARAYRVISEHLASGESAETGSRSANAGPRRLPPAGTRLVGSGVFLEGADVTSVVGETLLIEASKQRHQQVQRIVGDEVDFTPRRRADIDSVIALIDGGQLASLKPALAFHFASDLPIYASSQAARDVPDRGDLELLRICDMPWRLFPPKIKAQVREAFPNNRGTADALFAFGFDAYRLANQMSRLSASTDSSIMGVTGILQLGPDGVIRREPVWGMARNGRFEPLAPAPAPSHGTNASRERQRPGALVPCATRRAGPQAKPKAAAVGHFHGTNVSGERQRPGTIGPWSTSGAGPEPSAGGARGDTPRKRKFEAEGCGCGALPWNKRVRGAPATRHDWSMVDERGRARAFSRGARGDTPRKRKFEAEGCGCGALFSARCEPGDNAPVSGPRTRPGDTSSAVA